MKTSLGIVDYGGLWTPAYARGETSPGKDALAKILQNSQNVSGQSLLSNFSLTVGCLSACPSGGS